ncbi:MAG: hypothetical protein FD181_2970 [Prolixibacteraceae bacterium]|nr:MAG: hypothetical protein FD181_2970 [Prolixibacteraceae bacterium]
MKNGQKHIINSEVLEITVSDRGHAYSIQNKVSEIVREKLNPALDQLFSKTSGSGEIVRIEKLIIDLGTISGKELENELVDKTISKIRDKIELLLSAHGSAVIKKQANTDGRYVNTSEVSVTNRLADKLAQFVYFLEHGYFPWWGTTVVKNLVSSTYSFKNILKEVLNVENALLKNTIVPLLKKEQVRKRLLFQCNHSCLYELFKRLNLNLFESYSVQFQHLLSCAGSAQISKLLNLSFHETTLLYFSTETELNTENQKIAFVKDILVLSLSKKPEAEKESILHDILRAAQIKTKVSKQKDLLLVMVAVIQIATELTSKSQLFQQMIQNFSAKDDSVINTLIEQSVKKAKKENTEKNNAQKYESVKSSGVFFAKKVVVLEEKVEGEITKKGKGEGKGKVFSIFPSKPDIVKEQIVIFNAGLVLVHPFLRYFFEGLNLLNAELQFRSGADVFKAAHLLQFIATGEEATLEACLPLNKILCGLGVTEPVPLNVPISGEEKKECLFLIKTVLERWEALKTTNPAALRDTYLQRRGILKQTGQSWTLTVERNTFDVMLEKLPWSFSLVKLPWYEQILNVEW